MMIAKHLLGIAYEIAEDKDAAFEVEKPHFPFTTTPADPATKPHLVDALNKISQQKTERSLCCNVTSFKNTWPRSCSSRIFESMWKVSYWRDTVHSKTS